MQNSRPRSSVQERQRVWTDHLASWRSSGLSQREYCRRHSLSVNTLHYWRKKLSKQQTKKAGAPDITFVPVTLPDFHRESCAPKPGPLMVHVGRDFRIEVQGDFDQNIFAKIVLSLERL